MCGISSHFKSSHRVVRRTFSTVTLPRLRFFWETINLPHPALSGNERAYTSHASRGRYGLLKNIGKPPIKPLTARNANLIYRMSVCYPVYAAVKLPAYPLFFGSQKVSGSLKVSRYEEISHVGLHVRVRNGLCRCKRICRLW